MLQGSRGAMCNEYVKPGQVSDCVVKSVLAPYGRLSAGVFILHSAPGLTVANCKIPSWLCICKQLILRFFRLGTAVALPLT